MGPQSRDQGVMQRLIDGGIKNDLLQVMATLPDYQPEVRLSRVDTANMTKVTTQHVYWRNVDLKNFLPNFNFTVEQHLHLVSVRLSRSLLVIVKRGKRESLGWISANASRQRQIHVCYNSHLQRQIKRLWRSRSRPTGSLCETFPQRHRRWSRNRLFLSPLLQHAIENGASRQRKEEGQST